MSTSYKIKVIPFPVNAGPTPLPLHDGTNGEGYDKRAAAFVIQATGETNLGESTITGSTDSYTVGKGSTSTFIPLLSRGTEQAYDLTKILYLGGPFKLVLEVPAK